eukprot:gnl/TRDRNA2_/TRDRNA2_177037_c6_seq15.p1 gnl/TRDRNA2_/TRDRNA2_177037_c6~~gnl/TRDRNA2_/TRDRNA2_177037_c6_seq15.p1  ORF type:complete len:478 (-),score=56.39 gnl/TRDRNA2_/TRDRNA2_177037_c6_seq15:80-1513(-)
MVSRGGYMPPRGDGNHDGPRGTIEKKTTFAHVREAHPEERQLSRSKSDSDVRSTPSSQGTAFSSEGKNSHSDSARKNGDVQQCGRRVDPEQSSSGMRWLEEGMRGRHANTKATQRGHGYNKLAAEDQFAQWWGEGSCGVVNGKAYGREADGWDSSDPLELFDSVMATHPARMTRSGPDAPVLDEGPREAAPSGMEDGYDPEYYDPEYYDEEIPYTVADSAPLGVGAVLPAERQNPALPAGQNDFAAYERQNPALLASQNDFAAYESAVLEVGRLDAGVDQDELHEMGKCRPCIWATHRDGCQQGENCPFCHKEHKKTRRTRPGKDHRARLKQLVGELDRDLADDPDLFMKAAGKLAYDNRYMRNILRPKMEAYEQMYGKTWPAADTYDCPIPLGEKQKAEYAAQVKAAKEAAKEAVANEGEDDVPMSFARRVILSLGEKDIGPRVKKVKDQAIDGDHNGAASSSSGMQPEVETKMSL